MLDLVNVAKRFGSVTALDATTVTFERSRVYVLLGTSGCGKSTLLKLALGLLEPDTGFVRFDGERVTADKTARVRQRIGYVIQHGGLFPHLSARDNVTIIARHTGWNASQIKARLNELCELTQLPPDSLQRYPVQLSGGQQQRVALMRALLRNPDVLLMDEPLGALDPIIRADMQAELKEIFSSLGKTVVMVTHDLREAVYFADEIVLMHAGAIVQRGTIRDLTESPANEFVTRFVTAQGNATPRAST